MRPIEQKADSVLLGTAALLSALGLTILIRAAGDPLALTAVSVYGATLVIAYCCSGLYEARIGSAKSIAVFRALDHSTIFLLIAGTYTPICALALADRGGWWVLAANWGVALTGISVRLIWLRRPRHWPPTLYLMQGLIGVPWVPALLHSAGVETMALIAAGGAVYTVGILFYLWRGFRYGTLTWHLFVVTGSLCHFFAVMRLVRG